MTAPRRIVALAWIAALACCSVEPPAPAKQEKQGQPQPEQPPQSEKKEKDAMTTPTTRETATFGAGCFWCVEAVLEQLDGVLDVKSGYMGGKVDKPTYDQVCSGDSGHAEVVQVEFDPKKITFDKLLDWFFKLHDPTTLDRQGGDVGTQYRSVVFWHSDGQRQATEAKIKALTQAKAFADPIVTQVAKAATFWPAEDYHQDYYRGNKSKNPYCRAVITPKLDKLGLEK